MPAAFRLLASAGLALVVAGQTATVSSGTLSATISNTEANLTWTTAGGNLRVTIKEGWSVIVQPALSQAWTLSPASCTPTTFEGSSGSVTVGYTCPVDVYPSAVVQFAVTVVYKATGNGTSKDSAGYFDASIEVVAGGNYTVLGANFFGTPLAGVTEAVKQMVAFSSPREIGSFMRFADGTSLYATVKTPFGLHTFADGVLTVGYSGATNHTAGEGTVVLPGAVLGMSFADKYTLPSGVSVREAADFKDLIRAYMWTKPATKTLKLNCAWDENDYQIDYATAAGRAEYKRIIDQASNLGLSHLIFGPQNSQYSSRFNTTDGWGWETVLWFSLGEQLREGTWDPRVDDVPQDIKDAVAYGKSVGVGFLAYVYPAIGFQALKDYFVSTSPGQIVDLGQPAARDWLLETMDLFLQKSGAAGFAFDHSITAGDPSLNYQQWLAWQYIMKTLLERHPNLVVDYRQSAHAWGPWHLLGPSYAEPLAGDENPETYGVFIPNFHQDLVTAHYLRYINYWYSTGLIPMDRIPGFVSHQTERTDDNGTYSCFGGEPLCYDSNIRDFDLLGYPYNYLSSIATAGLNQVWAMIPARDEAEFNLLPKADRDFIVGWGNWTDENIDVLRRMQTITTLPPPSYQSVDGTAGFSKSCDKGFIFLFNTGYVDMAVNLTLDSSLGYTCGGRDVMYNVTELYPMHGRALGTWPSDTENSFVVGGNDARVLSVTPYTGRRAARVVDGVQYDEATGKIRGPTGQTVAVTVTDQSRQAHVSGVTLGDRPCRSAVVKSSSFDGEFHTRVSEVQVKFGGDRLARSMPAAITGQVGNSVLMNATISTGMRDQLTKRASIYPIPWTTSPEPGNDYNAVWLVPTRLPMYFLYSQPNSTWDVSLTVNNEPAVLHRAFTSRGRNVSNTFTGFWWNATEHVQQAPISFQLNLTSPATASFLGAFWENVVLDTTDSIASC
ncbi:hypothetical protein DIPPA_05933 [Diplonema papillatum]|nr:hypothetical protein DIPPA_05933 [Diplonema papillatum]